MDVCHFLRNAGSVARTRTILKAGFSDREIRNAAASGELCRLRHGVLALREAPQDFVTAVLGNGLLTCASGAPHRGLWLLHGPDKVHLLCRHGGPPNAVVHRGSLVPHGTAEPVASTTDILIHGLRCLPDDVALPASTAAGEPQRSRPQSPGPCRRQRGLTN